MGLLTQWDTVSYVAGHYGVRPYGTQDPRGFRTLWGSTLWGRTPLDSELYEPQYPMRLRTLQDRTLWGSTLWDSGPYGAGPCGNQDPMGLRTLWDRTLGAVPYGTPDLMGYKAL